eukprot:Skav209704  [mRNA]  locus=scaffold36:211359:212645:+ [translate_table: standard]
MKGTVCQLHYHGGGCLRSAYPRPDGSRCETTWPFATAPQELKVGDAVTFTLTEGRQAVDLQVAVSEPKTERAPETAAMTSPRTDGEAAALKVQADAAAQRKLQRNMNRFHNANLEEQLAMLRRAEEGLNAVKAGDEMDGKALCSLVNKLAGYLHAPAETIAVANGAGDASTVAGSRNAEVQQKVRKLLIGCLELLDLSDRTTYELVDTAVQHITQLVINKLNQNHPDKDPPSLYKKRSLAVGQWQALAALVGANQDDASPLVSADAVPGTGKCRAIIRDGDMASTTGGRYRPSRKVRNLPSVREDKLDVVTLKCSECYQTLTSSWFWQHPKKETVHVLAPSFGHSACTTRTGKRCPWLPIDGRPRVLDNFQLLDFCVHKRQRPNCVACGGSGICEHKRRYRRCKYCKSAETSRTTEARIRKSYYIANL